MSNFKNSIALFAKANYSKEIKDLTNIELHDCVSKAVMAHIGDNIKKSQLSHNEKRRAYYFSAEFLVGRAIYNNLLCTGLLSDAEKLLQDLIKNNLGMDMTGTGCKTPAAAITMADAAYLIAALEEAAQKKGRHAAVSYNRSQAVLHVTFPTELPGEATEEEADEGNIEPTT